MRLYACSAAMVLAVSLAAASAHATTVTVNATDDLYRANGTVPSDGGTDPISLNLNGATSLTFSGVTGSIILNHGTGDNSNNADGVGSASGISVSAANSLSGISAYQAGFLAGVFLGVPAVVPSDLSYPDAGSEAALSYSPALQQVFFIGDGLTGNGSGTGQTFNVPTGATTLWLGITDAPGYSGSPGAYGDNLGSFQVTVNGIPAGVPEPSIWAFALLGVGIAGGALRAGRRPAVTPA